MATVQVKNSEVQIIPADALETMVMHDSGIRTEEAVLGKAKWQSRLRVIINMKMQTDAILVSGKHGGQYVQAEEATLGTKWKESSALSITQHHSQVTCT
jgi:3-phosphoglycerate kinase